MFPASPADGGLGSFRSGMMQYEFEKHNGFALHSLDDDVDDDSVSSPDDNTSPPSGVSSLGLARGAHPCSKAGTVEVLRPEEIRWFYKAEGDRKWTTFDGYDSQRIEFKHRELEQLRPADAGTEGQDQPAESAASGGDPRLPAGELGPAGDSGDDTVSVRGGLYQVDVLKRTCFPIYWSAEGHTSSVMRGTWFLDGTWQPVEETYADQIEAEHLRQFEHQRVGGSPEPTVKGPLTGKLIVSHSLQTSVLLQGNLLCLIHYKQASYSRETYYLIHYKQASYSSAPNVVI
ncbi:Phospholipase DDHD1 [Lamellibrachia satsuma]|nr:Phospholipase DDHD1 [Lamellibrachia satsuma]